MPCSIRKTGGTLASWPSKNSSAPACAAPGCRSVGRSTISPPRTNVSASTISRIETGKRTISLDLLVPLCEAMQTDMNVLLDTSDAEDDVVIRPVATPYHHGGTIWPLTRNRDATGIVAVKMRLEPGDVDARVVRARCARRPRLVLRAVRHRPADPR